MIWIYVALLGETLFRGVSRRRMVTGHKVVVAMEEAECIYIRGQEACRDENEKAVQILLLIFRSGLVLAFPLTSFAKAPLTD